MCCCDTWNALAFSLVLATTAIAQVKITIPAHRYKAHDEIHAKLENTDKKAVTFCVEFGQTLIEMPLPTPRLLYKATAVEGWFLEMPSRWAARTSLCSISAANNTA